MVQKYGQIIAECQLQLQVLVIMKVYESHDVLCTSSQPTVARYAIYIYVCTVYMYINTIKKNLSLYFRPTSAMALSFWPKFLSTDAPVAWQDSDLIHWPERDSCTQIYEASLIYPVVI